MAKKKKKIWRWVTEKYKNDALSNGRSCQRRCLFLTERVGSLAMPDMWAKLKGSVVDDINGLPENADGYHTLSRIIDILEEENLADCGTRKTNLDM